MQNCLNDKLPVKPDLIIFDLDGTLYDQKKLRSLLKRNLLFRFITLRIRFLDFRIISYFRKQRELLKSYHSDRLLEEQFERCATALGVTPERVRKSIETYMFHLPLQFLRHTKYEGVDTFFTMLRRKKIKTAIYSDYPVKEKLKVLELVADAVYCSTDKAIGQLKPSLKALHYICAEMGSTVANTVYIGDRDDTDGEGARLAGISFIPVDRKKAVKGMFYSELSELFTTDDE